MGLATLDNATRPPEAVERTPLWKRQTMIVARWLHIYLSMVSFAILFFFALTGLTLNHTEWFAGQQSTVQVHGAVDTKFLGKEVAKLEIVEYLRARHGIRGAVKDFRAEELDCSVSFKGPGYSADAIIDRASGKYDLTETRMGVFAVLNDLHKGRDTGPAWAWMIDISAVLMCLVSATGLLLILFLRKKRSSGLLVGLAGAILCALAYRLWVP